MKVAKATLFSHVHCRDRCQLQLFATGNSQRVLAWPWEGQNQAPFKRRGPVSWDGPGLPCLISHQLLGSGSHLRPRMTLTLWNALALVSWAF